MHLNVLGLERFQFSLPCALQLGHFVLQLFVDRFKRLDLPLEIGSLVPLLLHDPLELGDLVLEDVHSRLSKLQILGVLCLLGCLLLLQLFQLDCLALMDPRLLHVRGLNRLNLVELSSFGLKVRFQFLNLGLVLVVLGCKSYQLLFERV